METTLCVSTNDDQVKVLAWGDETHGSSIRKSSQNDRALYISTEVWLKYSGTSDNGHYEEWTTSLQWTNCSPPTYIIIVHTFLPQKKGQPLNNGQNTPPQSVHYSEVPLYPIIHDKKYIHKFTRSTILFLFIFYRIPLPPWSKPHMT